MKSPPHPSAGAVRLAHRLALHETRRNPLLRLRDQGAMIAAMADLLDKPEVWLLLQKRSHYDRMRFVVGFARRMAKTFIR